MSPSREISALIYLLLEKPMTNWLRRKVAQVPLGRTTPSLHPQPSPA
jgi:hypothetical protein